MDDNILLKWLNWFYSLEIGQVDLYINQAKKCKDMYIAHALLNVAEIECKHAEMFNDIIVRLGSKPYKIDSLISYITGYLPGQLTPLTGTVNQFFYNYTIETIAIEDYKKLIKKVEPRSEVHQYLLNILMSNMIDEDFHRIWFKDRRESLKKLKKGRTWF